MEHFKRIYLIVLILNFVHGCLCEDKDLTGVIAASTVAGFLLCLVIIAAVIFTIWRDTYKKQQLRQGKIKIPRIWLEQDRLAKKQRRQRLKQHIKEQMKQKQLMVKPRPDGTVPDVEMNNIYRTRPQIPGSWRREIRHPNGYIVKEVPTLQRVPVAENHYAQAMVIDVTDDNPAVWQPSPGNQYTQPTASSIVIPQSARTEEDSSSQSSGSTTMAGNRLIRGSNDDEEVIEATIDFTNDGAFGEENMIQENVTAF